MGVNTLNRFDDDFDMPEWVAETQYMETFETTFDTTDTTEEAQDKPEDDPYMQAKQVKSINNLIRDEIDKPHTCKKGCICVKIRIQLDLADKHLSNILSIFGGKRE